MVRASVPEPEWGVDVDSTRVALIYDIANVASEEAAMRAVVIGMRTARARAMATGMVRATSGATVRARARAPFRATARRISEEGGLLPTTPHSFLYSRVGQMAIFSHCQP